MNLRLRNGTHDWGLVARALHWLVALLIVVQVVLGKIATDMAFSPAKIDMFVWHKSIGVSVLALVVLRIGWRLSGPVPAPPGGRYATLLARAGHSVLYALLLAVPVSGWWVSDTSRVPLRIFWQLPAPDFLAPDRAASELASNVHDFLASALIIVALGHALVALWHHFRLRDDTLRRMLTDRRKA